MNAKNIIGGNVIKESSFDFIHDLIAKFSNANAYEKIFKKFGANVDYDNGRHNITWSNFKKIMLLVVKNIYMAKSKDIIFNDKWLMIIENNNNRKYIFVCEITLDGKIYITNARFRYTRGPYHLTRYEIDENTLLV